MAALEPEKPKEEEEGGRAAVRRGCRWGRCRERRRHRKRAASFFFCETTCRKPKNQAQFFLTFDL